VPLDLPAMGDPGRAQLRPIALVEFFDPSARSKSLFKLAPGHAGLTDDRLQRANANFSVIG
jgi:hypothetical protein